jgi:hypothetical protein
MTDTVAQPQPQPQPQARAQPQLPTLVIGKGHIDKIRQLNSSLSDAKIVEKITEKAQFLRAILDTGMHRYYWTELDIIASFAMIQNGWVSETEGRYMAEDSHNYILMCRQFNAHQRGAMEFMPTLLGKFLSDYQHTGPDHAVQILYKSLMRLHTEQLVVYLIMFRLCRAFMSVESLYENKYGDKPEYMLNIKREDYTADRTTYNSYLPCFRAIFKEVLVYPYSALGQEKQKGFYSLMTDAIACVQRIMSDTAGLDDREYHLAHKLNKSQSQVKGGDQHPVQAQAGAPVRRVQQQQHQHDELSKGVSRLAVGKSSKRPSKQRGQNAAQEQEDEDEEEEEDDEDGEEQYEEQPRVVRRSISRAPKVDRAPVRRSVSRVPRAQKPVPRPLPPARRNSRYRDDDVDEDQYDDDTQSDPDEHEPLVNRRTRDLQSSSSKPVARSSSSRGDRGGNRRPIARR